MKEDSAEAGGAACIKKIVDFILYYTSSVIGYNFDIDLVLIKLTLYRINL